MKVLAKSLNLTNKPGLAKLLSKMELPEGFDVQAAAANTAMSRNAPSAPARKLAESGKVRGRVLDYGCGRGADCRAYQWEGFDPTHQPTMPEGTFDTILNTYVLNVLPPEYEHKILSDIHSKLNPGGAAFITVRSKQAVPEAHITSKGTYQRPVELPLPIEQKDREYTTYRLDHGALPPPPAPKTEEK